MEEDRDFQRRIDIVTKKFKLSEADLLGKGGEGWVYAFEGKALKIYVHNPDISYLKELENFQSSLEQFSFSFSTPQIYEIGQVDDILYTVEKRLLGIPMDRRIIDLNTSDRQTLFLDYYRAIQQVNKISFPNLPYGQIIERKGSFTADSWVSYLTKALDYKVSRASLGAKAKIDNFDEKVSTFKTMIRAKLQSDKRQLIHCDYYMNNVLVDDESLKISAILDFGVHTSVGDPRIDVTSVLRWNSINPNVEPEDYKFLVDIAKKDYGDDIEAITNLYLLFSSFYFIDMEDPSFSIENLNNNYLWEKVK